MPPPEKIVAQTHHYIPRETEEHRSSIKDSKVAEMVVLTTFHLPLRLVQKMYGSWRTAVDCWKANQVVILIAAAVLDILFLFK